MANLGTGYVQIVPSAQGLSGSIANLLSPEATSAGDQAGSLFGGGLISKAKVAVLAGGAAIGAALVSVTKSAVEQFAEYEQLVGGAQLMFGEAYDYIAEKASGAYSTVQMSQNDYLTQVNGFATGLKTALGGNEMAAAQLADKIITAEADIVAATGNSQENIQNAFNGIMKGNYTMLDNLQIGIKPTKEGFQEVIDKVNDYNAAQGNATNYTIDNLADCEAALVDYVAMVGMSGYAQREASQTIEGSLAATKAAWSNLLVGLASGEGDMKLLVSNLMTSATQLIGNVIPIIGNVVSAIPSAVMSFLSSGLPVLLKAGASLVKTIAEGLATGMPELINGAINLIDNFASGIESGGPSVLSKGVELIGKLIEGIISRLPDLAVAAVKAITHLVTAIISQLPSLVASGVQLLVSLVSGIISSLPRVMVAAIQIITTIVSTVAGKLGDMVSSGANIVKSIASGIAGAISTIIQKASEIFSKFKSAITGQNWSSLGKSIIQGITSGISGALGTIKDAAVKAAKSALDAAKKFLGINSPSRVFRDQVGSSISEGIGAGIVKGRGFINSALDEITTKSLNNASINSGNIRFGTSSNDNDVICAMYDAVNGVIDTLDKLEQNTYLDGKRVGGSIGQYNAQQMRRYGRVSAAY